MITNLITPIVRIDYAMSITKIRWISKNPDLVIIRGFGGRPAKLEVVDVSATAVEVIGTDRQNPMPFHLEDAYEFDEGLFGGLIAAFQRKDSDALSQLWQHARPYRARN